MNLVTMNQQQTMSSREIAALTNKEHRNILSDIRNLLEGLNLITADFSAVYKADNGQEYECFNLPKRECLILVSGYSIALRAKIIDRWQELENQQPKQLPQTYKQALLALIEAEEEKEQLALALEDKTIQLDESKQWLSIKRVATLNNISWKEIDWRPLKNAGIAIGYAPRKIFDSNFGMVNAYHIESWKLVYPSLGLKN